MHNYVYNTVCNNKVRQMFADYETPVSHRTISDLGWASIGVIRRNYYEPRLLLSSDNDYILYVGRNG